MQRINRTDLRKPSVLCLLLLYAIGTIGCASDLTNSVNGRRCSTDNDCLTDWECDEGSNTCVRRKDDEPADGATDSEPSKPDAQLSDVSVETDSNIVASEGGTLDAAIDAFVCGQGAEPTGTDTTCPTPCGKCEDSTCYIYCDEQRKCDKDEIICPPDFDCVVQCSEELSCDKAKITCPRYLSCSISCTGKLSCSNTAINCSEGPCELTCDTGTLACQNASLNCGTQKCEAICGTDQVHPTVNDCDDSCSTTCACQ